MASNRLKRSSSGMFQDWPVIDYDGQAMQKLTTKINMPANIAKNTSLFFSHTIKDSDTRPEAIAKKFYNDPKLDWVVLFSNKIMDPMFQWPMNAQSFNQFIIDKYVSTAAEATTHNYKQVNRLDNISAAAYNALTTGQQKFWIYHLDPGGNIIDYSYVDSGWEITAAGWALLGSEQSYFDHITKYDYEFNLNNDRRIINLLNPAYLPQFLAQYKSALK